jgi:hypothetical protein
LASRIYYQIETISMADVCHFSLFWLINKIEKI